MLSLVTALTVAFGFTAVDSTAVEADYLATPLHGDNWDLYFDHPETLRPYRLDLSPAQWIWFPSHRTLSNTFILFRKEIDVGEDVPVTARGWITADSRYRLTVNGERVQWGPAPFDPRYQEADPFDITAFLKPGKNVIGVEVLHYGLGDGTWPGGKPGLLFHGELIDTAGNKVSLVSDSSWLSYLDRAHKPGQHKRWFLRSLQEEFDSRLHPVGWDTIDYCPGGDWLPAMGLRCPADKPSACSFYQSNDLIDRVHDEFGSLRTRQIPLMAEHIVAAKQLADSGRMNWLRDPHDWFDMRVPGSFEVIHKPAVQEQPDGTILVPATAADEGIFLTLEFEEQLVGWPQFTIDAAEGTVVELMIQESHEEDGPAWLETHLFSWSRFICREGQQDFEPFDYESFRWVQLHIRNASRPVTISQVGARRRLTDWPAPAVVQCDDATMQSLFDATVNTLHNSAQDIVVDGMGRERQQYSGDCGPQLFCIRQAFGNMLLPARYIRTYSEGNTPDGYFLDSWPAFDRLARVMQKQMQGATWGPILDHGVGFIFDCWHHYLETGDAESVAEAYPRLLRFADYLWRMRQESGLLPVVNLGIPTVWIDHDAYQDMKHKECAFNLYAAAMYEYALAPLARVFAEEARALLWEERAASLVKAIQERYWDEERRLFVANLPWEKEEGAMRLCDRSLATAILYNYCPGNDREASLQALVDCPAEMGLSYPANAYWRYWALARMSRMDVVLGDFRSRWATMGSVIHNNTLQENWTANPDSTAEWSHCPVAPLYILHMDIVGLRPTEAGFAACDIRPQLSTLGALETVIHTVKGAFTFQAEKKGDLYEARLTVPEGCEATLILPEDLPCTLPSAEKTVEPGLKAYALTSGEETVFITR
jgi:alpha-L-rhamnosidase